MWRFYRTNSQSFRERSFLLNTHYSDHQSQRICKNPFHHHTMKEFQRIFSFHQNWKCFGDPIQSDISLGNYWFLKRLQIILNVGLSFLHSLPNCKSAYSMEMHEKIAILVTNMLSSFKCSFLIKIEGKRKRKKAFYQRSALKQKGSRNCKYWMNGLD